MKDKDPPPRPSHEDCAKNNFLPCLTSRRQVPIYDFANEHSGLENECMEEYYTCCGKKHLRVLLQSFRKL